MRGSVKSQPRSASSVRRSPVAVFDHRDLCPQVGLVVPDGPAGDGPGAVGRQVGRLLVQRPARLGSQVTGRPGQPAVGGHGRQQPRLIGAQVVIPVPDRRGFVQDRADPRILAPLAALRVIVQPGRPRQQRGHEHQPWGAAGRDDPADTAGRGGDPAGVTAGRGQQPQRGFGAVLRSAAVLVGRSSRRVRPFGGEQQRAVGQERRAVLALRRLGQPGGLARRLSIGAVGRDPPDAGYVLLAVRVRLLDGHGQPGPVWRQAQAGHPGNRDVGVQVLKWRHRGRPAGTDRTGTTRSSFMGNSLAHARRRGSPAGW